MSSHPSGGADISRSTLSVHKNCRQYRAEIRDDQVAIVYSPDYNITFWGLQKLHPFDSIKWGRIVKMLKDAGVLKDSSIIEPFEISEAELLAVHSKDYLKSLKWSINVARITEVPPIIFIPNFLIQKKVLRPFRLQTSGSIMAGRLAIERGWAINIGGGFHHCSKERGGGFCSYADTTLAIKAAFENVEGLSRVMIIDVDAHQGNGHERDFMDDPRVYIVDIYNREIYPNDIFAKRAIKQKVELPSFTKNKTYMKLLHSHVNLALKEFTPQWVVYIAGTDVIESDPLGCLSVTPEGVIERDQYIFEKFRSKNIPILMLTGGGYLQQSAKVVADSIENLHKLGLISCGGSAATVNETDGRPVTDAR